MGGFLWITLGGRYMSDEILPLLQGDLHVFVSHSSSDNKFGIRLERMLQAESGIATVWYDSDGGLHGGDRWVPSIEREMETRNVFLVILSPEAMKSRWVKIEIEKALEEVIARGLVIIPVMHRKTPVQGFLSLYHYVDFTQQPYQDAYRELVTAILMRTSRRKGQEGQDLLPDESNRVPPPFDLSELKPPDQFIGRAADLKWILGRLLEIRPGQPKIANIVAANGIGGIGKTALASEVVRRLIGSDRFRDGIAVVVCGELRDPLVVLRRVLSRFTPNHEPPNDASLEMLIAATYKQFKGSDTLVVLDNVEPGWPVEKVVMPLRQAGVALLLTAREPLPESVLPQEANLRLDVLPSAEAINLFASCYTAITRSAFDVHEMRSARRIVNALGKHTLAVRLAAFHAAEMRRDLGAYALELEQNPFHVAGVDVVTSILDASYQSLPGPAQQLFVSIAIFAQQDVGREAFYALGRALGVENTELEQGLLQMIRLGLVDSFDDTAMPVHSDRERLRFHPLVAQYARHLLAPDTLGTGGERAISPSTLMALFSRLTRHYIDYIRRMTPYDRGELEANLYLAIDRDEANIEAALDGSRGVSPDEDQIQLTEAMRRYWQDRWRTEEALRYLPIGIQAGSRLTKLGQDRHLERRLAKLELAYARALMRSERWDAARRALEQNRLTRRALEDSAGEGIVLSRMAELVLAQCRLTKELSTQALHERLDQAERYLNQSIPIHQKARNWLGMAIDMQLMATIAERRDNWILAANWLKQALEVYQEYPNPQGEGVMLAALGKIALRRGETSSAIGYYSHGLEALRRAEDARNIATVALEFGEHLVNNVFAEQLSRNEAVEKGCALIREAIMLLHTRRLPGEATAIELARKLGCLNSE